MTSTKRPKSIRNRGTNTHGCGSMKKRRGAGNRGGRGNAGSGKRAHTKKPTKWKYNINLGKRAFSKKGRVIGRRSISLRNLELQRDKLLNAGKITQQDDGYHVDVKSLGYDKLVGNGRVTCKWIVSAPQASQQSMDKVTEAGGTVQLPGQQ